MNRFLLTCVIILHCFFSAAQQYSCFQRNSEPHWFIDSIGYLRAIRIDSVTVSGTDTVFHPFLTRRPPASAIIGPPSPSWVCKDVHEKPDGTFLFKNVYGDTIFIKTNVMMGDTWVFYNDSTTRYYTATVTSEDTMTIEGVVDSVKYITINAFAPVYDPSDYVNNLTLGISKYHGFAQVFDLYNFPYHTPNVNYLNTYDRYVQILNVGSARSQLFKAFNYKPLTTQELYNFNVGDVFQYKTWSYCGCPTSYGLEGYEHDTVIYRNAPDPYHTTIYIQKTTYSRGIYCMAPDAGIFGYGLTVDTLRLDTSIAYPISPLPEEAGQRFAYYYYPEDTSNCMRSASMYWVKAGLFEECADPMTIKAGFGTLSKSYCNNCIGVPEPVFTPIQTDMIYSYKSSVGCGSRYPMTVTLVNSAEPSVTVKPSPAHDNILLALNKLNKKCKYTLISTLGHSLRTGSINDAELTLDVSDILSGVYYLVVSTEDGEILTTKFVVMH